MKKGFLALTGLAVAVALVGPALGLGSADGRKVSDAKVLAPVTEPYTLAANAIRGVPGGGLPWEIGDATADLRADGRLQVEVEGLVLARRPPVPANLQGTNPIPQFKAIVSCLTTANGTATTSNVPTAPVPASPTGDAQIDAVVDLPAPCFAPIVFVTSPGGNWFAVTGR
ncbi:MAG TPA: hypothetical protein VHR46_01510 [Gaiella sp.]|jgi:hypothetical protein|nr:hypothetical protein [Gaiella sp.]